MRKTIVSVTLPSHCHFNRLFKKNHFIQTAFAAPSSPFSHPLVSPRCASWASAVTPHRLRGPYTYAAASAAPPEVDKFPQWLLTQLPLSSGATSRCCFHSHPGSRTDFLVSLLTPACYYQRWLQTTLHPAPHLQSSRDFYSFPSSLSFYLLVSFFFRLFF